MTQKIKRFYCFFGFFGRFATEQKKNWVPKYHSCWDISILVPRFALPAPLRPLFWGHFEGFFKQKCPQKYVSPYLNPCHCFLRLIGTPRTHFRAQNYLKSNIFRWNRLRRSQNRPTRAILSTFGPRWGFNPRYPILEPEKVPHEVGHRHNIYVLCLRAFLSALAYNLANPNPKLRKIPQAVILISLSPLLSQCVY